MKNNKYATFKKEVQSAPNDSYIWYAGYLWIDLTRRQALDIIEVLKARNFPIVKAPNGKDTIKIPSGMGIFIDQEV